MFEGKTKADFRALREMLGLRQDEVAAAVGVQTQTVKKWEKESFPQLPPKDAWQYLTDMQELHYKIVEEAVNTVKETEQQVGNEPRIITLTYYRDQDDYNRHGRDAGSFRVVNARARAVAVELERLKYKVRFEYPTSKGNLYKQAVKSDD